MTWLIRNVLVIQAWLLVTVLVGIAILGALDEDPPTLVDAYLDGTALAAGGYLVYLGIVYLLPQRWSTRRRRIAAIALSPLIMTFMILPHFLPFALACGATIWLPERETAGTR